MTSFSWEAGRNYVQNSYINRYLHVIVFTADPSYMRKYTYESKYNKSVLRLVTSSKQLYMCVCVSNKT